MKLWIAPNVDEENATQGWLVGVEKRDGSAVYSGHFVESNLVCVLERR